MTLASLSQLTSSPSSSEYIPTSDEAEAARYAAFQLQGLGEEIVPDDDLRELEARL